ncbi:DUF3347 domain-containing protein [Zobellia barbeyronii]|uniref:DUF3347 domain-containing protein n=1 Tax=Zobellia barbeyronii TaxID=2748009 RepID=A0ABS5WA10_9FLAO|nr:DUF3347 domain-containing protein [Zobellia barbeyronii]MBT2160251.1 DUF3347 domain-containing protein [Zobellia barbeyronii]
MKKVSMAKGILAIVLIALTVASCKDTKKEHNDEDGNHSGKMEQDAMGDDKTDSSKKTMTSNGSDMKAEVVFAEYFELKDALVADNTKEAAEYGSNLVITLKDFNISKYSEEDQSMLKDIIENAKAHAEEISNSTIKKQRRYFKLLTEEVTKIIAITGSTNKVYEQFCPMYEGGSTWLSMSDEIQNPYYGSTMLQCGKVQREI